MKILLINQFYYQKGGAETVFFETKRILEAAGYEVVVFSMKHGSNRLSPQSNYFIDQIDLNKPEGLIKTIKKAGHFIWSPQAASRLARLIQAEKPQIAHIHNFYHYLTPSILLTLRRLKVPVVQTLHDFQILTPNHLLETRGRGLGLFKKFHWYNVFYYRGRYPSYWKSLYAGLAFYLHRLFKIYPRLVDRFITPSEFLKELAQEAGIKQPIDVLPNYLPIEKFEPDYEPGDYAICVSRLAEGKGLITLLHAARKLPQIKFKIIGHGPLLPKIKRIINQKKIRNIELTGYLEPAAVYEMMRGARLMIMPSETYEIYPMVIIEAMALGKPVLSSEIGGAPELVINGQTGWLFEPGNAADLIDKIKTLWPKTEYIRKIGQIARQVVEKNNSSCQAVDKLKQIYIEVLDQEAKLG